jgi:hypothetical protein
MLEIEDVHNYYPGEEDLRFPIITALLPQDFQTIYISFKSNNWKKMHHIPLKATTKNGHKIIRIKQDCYSSIGIILICIAFFVNYGLLKWM